MKRAFAVLVLLLLAFGIMGCTPFFLNGTQILLPQPNLTGRWEGEHVYDPPTTPYIAEDIAFVLVEDINGNLSGTFLYTILSSGGGNALSVGGRHTGTHVSFQAGARAFTGEITGRTMQGTWSSDSGTGTWEVHRTN